MLKSFRVSVVILAVTFAFPVPERQSFAITTEKKGEISEKNEDCYRCEKKSCSATFSTWKQLYEKFFLRSENKKGDTK